jgi:hypothetical protein
VHDVDVGTGWYSLLAALSSQYLYVCSSSSRCLAPVASHARPEKLTIRGGGGGEGETIGYEMAHGRPPCLSTFYYTLTCLLLFSNEPKYLLLTASAHACQPVALKRGVFEWSWRGKCPFLKVYAPGSAYKLVTKRERQRKKKKKAGTRRQRRVTPLDSQISWDFRAACASKIVHRETIWLRQPFRTL